MTLLKTLVHGDGFAIQKIDNMDLFSKLRQEFLERMEMESSEISVLRENLAVMNKFEINQYMLKLLNFNDASQIMAESCKDIIKNICGDQIFLQRRANIIFNLPGADQRRQWPHYEMMSGISPFTYVLWAPLHDIDDEGGIYYLNHKASLDLIKIEHSEGLVNGPTMFNRVNTEKAKKIKFGEVIIFNPFVLHGNLDFFSKLARIGCSIRVQDVNKPLMQKNTDFFKIHNFI